jgi:hypothetical protein
LVGREFAIITYRQNWGEDRVYFHDDQGRLTSLPTQWTSLFSEDPLISLSNAESFFRVPDLLELAQLMKKNQCTHHGLSTQKESDEVLHKLCQSVT